MSSFRLRLNFLNIHGISFEKNAEAQSPESKDHDDEVDEGTRREKVDGRKAKKGDDKAFTYSKYRFFFFLF
jgi:hypothetical protein